MLTLRSRIAIATSEPAGPRPESVVPTCGISGATFDCFCIHVGFSVLLGHSPIHKVRDMMRHDSMIPTLLLQRVSSDRDGVGRGDLFSIVSFIC